MSLGGGGASGPQGQGGFLGQELHVGESSSGFCLPFPVSRWRRGVSGFEGKDSTSTGWVKLGVGCGKGRSSPIQPSLPIVLDAVNVNH